MPILTDLARCGPAAIRLESRPDIYSRRCPTRANYFIYIYHYSTRIIFLFIKQPTTVYARQHHRTTPTVLLRATPKMTSYLEVTASWLFKNAKGHDAKAFTKAPAFSSCPEPSIQVTSPDCGDSGATLGPAYMHGGEGKLPSLTWDGDGVKGCQQWLVVSEDPDAPLPTPICHG